MIGPCKDCADRHKLCWNECVKYQAFQTKRKMIRDGRKREAELFYGPEESKLRRRKS